MTTTAQIIAAHQLEIFDGTCTCGNWDYEDLPYDSADPDLGEVHAAHVLEEFRDAGYVIVPVPEVGHKGPCDTDASALLQVAWNLDRDYSAGGSNVRRAVSELLRSVAHAATDDRRTTKERRRAGATA